MTTKANRKPIGYSVRGVVTKAGGAVKVAETLGLSHQAVRQWGDVIPSRHAEIVAGLAGLPLGVVRPDLVS
ncbi:Cro/CI family transcriptional regulator [Burkholderia sp. Bp8990]|uniref:Cro/CI family transcriptional regulator n=1 Tax=Burkholderia sp. Bp8990 TaxID=2184552 RepID=UPI000F59731E|nr:hypothetical protein DIE01_16450 [Burkholderia sp. Bp8990]